MIRAALENNDAKKQNKKRTKRTKQLTQNNKKKNSRSQQQTAKTPTNATPIDASEQLLLQKYYT